MKVRTALLVLAGGSAAMSGCGGGIFGRPAVEVPPAAPVAPVVVDGMRTSYADIVERTSPAVVQIEARHKQRPAQTQVPQDELFRQFQIPQDRRPPVERGVGSGVLVSADGTILTNHHVVDGADRISVTMSNNKSYEAKVVGSDQPSDLAVLKVDGSELPFVNLGDSDRVRVGDIVLAIGNPLGIGQTVTAGIISAKGRRTGLSDGSFEDFLQTDAPINRGNSGGALVNLNGELIGINSQILSGGAGGGNIGIAFSIPSNMARSVMDQLIKDGKVRRGMLGVNIQNITDEIAESTGLEQRSGVVVSNVRAGSAAEKAGVKRNDVITAVNGDKIDDTNVLRNKIAGTLPGTEIKLTILRDGKEMEITATLDEFDNAGSPSQEPGRSQNQSSPGPQEQSGKLGLSLQPLTEQTARRLGLEPQTQGVVVTAVDENGPASEAGVSTGDVILEIDRKPVTTLDDVRSALSATGSRPILLLITRRGQTAFVPVRPQN